MGSEFLRIYLLLFLINKYYTQYQIICHLYSIYFVASRLHSGDSTLLNRLLMESFDPALLFTPEKSLGPVNSPPSTSQPIPVKMTRPTRQTFFVSAPIIPAAQKKLYKAPAETSLKSEVEEAIDEVIGQYQEGNILYYFARLQGGIAHKVCYSCCMCLFVD